MKKYNSPMLSVVSISKKDIIATSLNRGEDLQSGIYEAGSAGRRMDDWDAGY